MIVIIIIVFVANASGPLHTSITVYMYNTSNKACEQWKAI